MTEPLATVSAITHGTGPLVIVRGEVDMSNAEPVGAEIRAAAATTAPATLDLSPVTFFDSSALHMLIRLSADFEKAGGRLTVIATPDSIVERLLTITQMKSYLTINP